MSLPARSTRAPIEAFQLPVMGNSIEGQNAWKAILAGAIIGGVTTVSALYSYKYWSNWWKDRLQEVHGTQRQPRLISMSQALDDDILGEQFTRNQQFFGRAGQEAVLNAFVVVVGLGGVGSHAANMLVRAGVGHLRLIDFDQVSLSSLNRHAVATRSDVGLPKATVLKDHISGIVPEAIVEAEVAMFTAEDEDRLLAGNPDFVVDAIDDIDTKIALLAACKRKGLQVICACGAGAKADPSRVRVADVSEASLDPLARKVRYRLRTVHGITSGIPMVLSTEKPRCPLIPVNQLSHDPYDLQIIPNFRIRTVPVLGTTPAIFGMSAASWILCQLAGQPYTPEPVFSTKAPEFITLLDRLVEREELVFGNTMGVDIDLDEIKFLARNVWRAKSAFSETVDPSAEKGLTRTLAKLHFTRWERSRPATVNNLILVTGREAEDHDAGGVEALKTSNPQLFAQIDSTMARASELFGVPSHVH